MKKTGLVIALAGLLSAAAATAQDVPAGVVLYTPAKAKWVPSLVPGVESSSIHGNQREATTYLGQSRFPPNFKILPHTHPDERHYTILSGTWYIGFGTEFDESKLIALPAGSFYTEPANTPHFVATKGDGATVQIGGKGPTAVNYVKQPEPAKK